MVNSKTMLAKITSLARPLDPSYPSNLQILVLCGGVLVAALGVGWFALERPFLQALWSAVLVAGWVFATWSLGRELDPDRPDTALWAAALTGVALLFLTGVWSARWADPRMMLSGLLITGFLMVCARVGLRSTGLPTTWPDVGTVAAGPLVASWLASAPLWPLAFAAGFALGSDARRDRDEPRFWVALSLCLAAGLLAFFLFGGPPPWGANWALGLFLLGAIGVGVRWNEAPVSGADDGGRLALKRLQGARASALIGGLAVGVVLGFVPVAGLGFVGLMMLLRFK